MLPQPPAPPRRPFGLNLRRQLASACRALALVIIAFADIPVRAAEHGSELIVQDVVCRGNAMTSCRFIRGYLFLRAGEHVDEEEIANAKVRLSWLLNFKSVDIHLEKGSQRGQVLVVIEVVEASPITTAFTLGFASRFGSQTETFSGDIGDRNLFGSGESLDLIFVGEVASSGNPAHESFARLQYYEPQLFGSDKFFLNVGAYVFNAAYRYDNGDRFDADAYGVDASFGRRFGAFSYFAVGYRYLPHSMFESVARAGDGAFETGSNSPRHLYVASYGFNSADDVYFPTQGSYLNFYNFWGGGKQSYGVGAEFGHTWRIGDQSFLQLRAVGEPTWATRAAFDNSPQLAITYGRDLHQQGIFAGIRRGRWYVGPGMTLAGFEADGRRRVEVALRGGLVLETQSIGYVNLYVFGGHVVRTSGH
jgi:hypothetical protein